MAYKVSIDSLDDEITKIVREFIKDENEKIRDVMPTIAKQSRSVLRAKSPGNGKYARGWVIEYENKYMQEYGFDIWNRKNYQLTHLLEKGHAKANQFGKYPNAGRTKAIPHVKVAQKVANELTMKTLKEIL